MGWSKSCDVSDERSTCLHWLIFGITSGQQVATPADLAMPETFRIKTGDGRHIDLRLPHEPVTARAP